MDQNENGGEARPGAEDDGLERPLKRARFGWVGPESHGLNKDQVERYSRQLLVPSFGVAGMFVPRTSPFCLCRASKRLPCSCRIFRSTNESLDANLCCETES